MKTRTALLLVVGLCILAGIFAWPRPARSGQYNLAAVRWQAACEETFRVLSLNREQWKAFGLESLVDRSALEFAAKGPTEGTSLGLAVARALHSYSRIGDVKPVLLISQDRHTCLVSLKHFYDGGYCIITLTLDDQDGWCVAAVEER